VGGKEERKSAVEVESRARERRNKETRGVTNWSVSREVEEKWVPGETRLAPSIGVFVTTLGSTPRAPPRLRPQTRSVPSSWMKKRPMLAQEEKDSVKFIAVFFDYVRNHVLRPEVLGNVIGVVALFWHFFLRLRQITFLYDYCRCDLCSNKKCHSETSSVKLE
jgi:hypothetical protein